MRFVQFYELLKIQTKGQEYCNVAPCIEYVISQKKLSCNGVHAVCVTKEQDFLLPRILHLFCRKRSSSLELVWFWGRGGEIKRSPFKVVEMLEIQRSQSCVGESAHCYASVVDKNINVKEEKNHKTKTLLVS